ncbi:hypothetical protein GINT2_000220 [Glugoides intestinalis]
MEFDAFGQYVIDNLSPLIRARWTFTAFLMIVYIRQIVIIKSHDVITYCVGIYLLHAFVLFVTPKDDNIPSPFENDDDEENYTPMNINNDFRPYVRKLPEFSFWQMCTQIILISYFLTFFPFTDLPVYRPVLVVYSIFILFMTTYKLRMHSKKFKYDLLFTRKSTLNE